MRSFFLAAAISAFTLTVFANPIPLADQLRAEGRSEHEILASLGARHPTPSLGEADVLSTEIFKRDAEPEPEPAAEAEAMKESTTKAVIEDVIMRTLLGVERGLEFVGVRRGAEPEADAYEGMQYTQPEYKLRLRA